MKKYHIPVLFNESLDYLNIKPEGTYVDCTLGEGGHSFGIFLKLNEKGTLLSIDQDHEAIQFVEEFYKDALNAPTSPKWIIHQSNFAKLLNVLDLYRLSPDGILMDLGLSSRQLEQERGFSFNEPDAPLDMRMDENLGVKASDLLKVLTEQELSKLFSKYGEERMSRQIARSIKKAIDNGEQLETVGELNELILRAVPAAVRQKGKHPSLRVFQALRIAVNDELNSLESALKDAVSSLSSQGRLVVITFHSLEDRIVKQGFIKFENDGLGQILTSKPVSASEEELEGNSRAHSAKLRAFQKR